LLIAVAALWLGPWRLGPASPASASIQFPISEAAQVSKDGLSALTLPTGSGPVSFKPSGGTAGGSAHLSTIGRWPLATAIVRSGNSWGSGAFISPDRYLLTNYHVVEEAAQQAAVVGEVARFDIITPRVAGDHLEPRESVSAELYRADPVHDLALLKLTQLPNGVNAMPAYGFGEPIQKENQCHAIGSKGGGRAWQIDDGRVDSRVTRPGNDRDRMSLTAVQTTAFIAPGDSGGPLLNERGQLVGLTFGTSKNSKGEQFGLHVDVPYLTQIAKNPPTQAEGVPFDIWTAGLPQAYLAKPVLGDEDHNGKVDTLKYRYFGSAKSDGSNQLLAVTIYADFAERLGSLNTAPPLGTVPFGIWGFDGSGKFRFDVFLMSRKDGVNAAGYTDTKGMVSEIRLGRSGDPAATLIWLRDAAGQWHRQQPGSRTPIVDAGRLGPEKMARLRVLAAELFGPMEGDRGSTPKYRGSTPK
jgi:hypothetical protein